MPNMVAGRGVETPVTAKPGESLLKGGKSKKAGKGGEKTLKRRKTGEDSSKSFDEDAGAGEGEEKDLLILLSTDIISTTIIIIDLGLIVR
jgi:hypothetical protein